MFSVQPTTYIASLLFRIRHMFQPEMPTIEDIEYPRAASWSSSTVEEILRDPLGKYSRF
jgi:hypothetical protein